MAAEQTLYIRGTDGAYLDLVVEDKDGEIVESRYLSNTCYGGYVPFPLRVLDYVCRPENWQRIIPLAELRQEIIQPSDEEPYLTTNLRNGLKSLARISVFTYNRESCQLDVSRVVVDTPDRAIVK